MVKATEGERLVPHLPTPLQWAQPPLTFFPFHCPTLYILHRHLPGFHVHISDDNRKQMCFTQLNFIKKTLISWCWNLLIRPASNVELTASLWWLTCLTHSITFNTAKCQYHWLAWRIPLRSTQQCQYHWFAWRIPLRSTQHSVSTTDLPDESHYVQHSTVSVPLICLTNPITFNITQCQYP
jgi:hypothetical protein